jgi:hypothetical protein
MSGPVNLAGEEGLNSGQTCPILKARFDEGGKMNAMERRWFWNWIL